MFLDPGCQPHGRARLITAAGVFFHLEELHSVVGGIEILLADDGVFVGQAIYLGGMVENTAFVLAWNFLNEFLLKEQAYLAAGGEFIVSIPEMRIVGVGNAARRS